MRRFYAAAGAALFSLTLGVAPQASAATLTHQPSVLTVDSTASQQHSKKDHRSEKESLRVATVNAGLSEDEEGALAERLEGGQDEAAQMLARNIQKTRPDVLLITDIDTDTHVADIFKDQYLAEAQTDGEAGSKDLSPLDYRYVYAAFTNAGVQSGADLNGNGSTGDPGDAFGVGHFEGQRSMILYSRYPIKQDEVRTFNNLIWSELPGSSLDTEKYSKLVRSVLPLNSTSLWDVPLDVEGETVHVVATGLTPNQGEGADPERRLDQLRFLNMYLSDSDELRDLTDDAGAYGGLEKDANAVVLGALGPDVESLDENAEQKRKDAAEELEAFLDSDELDVAKPSSAGAQCEDDASLQIRTILDFVCATQYATRIGGGTSRSDYVAAANGSTISESGIEAAMSRAVAEKSSAGTSSAASAGARRIVWADVTLKRD